jgi:hypothetical protein
MGFATIFIQLKLLIFSARALVPTRTQRKCWVEQLFVWLAVWLVGGLILIIWKTPLGWTSTPRGRAGRAELFLLIYNFIVNTKSLLIKIIFGFDF